MASVWAAAKEKYDRNLKVLQQDCAMHMANANWLLDVKSSGADLAEIQS